MTTKSQNMTHQTMENIQFKLTILPIYHGNNVNRWADRIKGGSSRVRTHGGASGSHGTSMTTNNSALSDVS